MRLTRCAADHHRLLPVPGSSGLRRPRRGNPVQLLESREFFYSEAVFLQWLHLAITIASVAILLMGYSSMAYVNPLKRPTLHTAEIICLLMLPCSCIIVGYAIRTYLWRRRRLHSMRYRCGAAHITGPGPVLFETHAMAVPCKPLEPTASCSCWY